MPSGFALSGSDAKEAPAAGFGRRFSTLSDIARMQRVVCERTTQSLRTAPTAE
jgi:hypothetical protein